MSTSPWAQWNTALKSKIDKSKIEQAKNEVKALTAAYNEANRYEAQLDRLNAQNKIVETVDKEFSKRRDDIRRRFDIILGLGEQMFSTKLLAHYESKLTKDGNRLEKSAHDLEQDERKYRRKFLDGDPQSGVSGLPGVRTSDDKVILTFWICFGAAVISLSLIAFNHFEIVEMKPKIFGIGTVVFVAYLIAYLCISYLG